MQLFLINNYSIQGLSQPQGLRRQFVPLKLSEGDKQEQLGDNFLIVITNNSKCDAVLNVKEPLPLKWFFFLPKRQK